MYIIDQDSEPVSDVRPNDAKKFGAAIKRRREDLAMTQMQLGAVLGVAHTYISQLEHGRRVSLTLNFHQRYARALQMTFRQYAYEVGLDLQGIPPADYDISPQRELLLRDLTDVTESGVRNVRFLVRALRDGGMLDPGEGGPPPSDGPGPKDA